MTATQIANLILGIRLVSVADGLDSDQEEAHFSIQLRGIANELFLTGLRKKVLRGLIGQKNRGFFVGERAFGYRSVPVGVGRRDKERIRDFQQTLELNTRLSALILRKVLGRIRLEVVDPEVGHPYYIAHTTLDVVELLDPRARNFSADPNHRRDPADRPQAGSNTLRLWRRGELNPRPKTAERWPLHAYSAI
jgi:hypothetical protein